MAMKKLFSLLAFLNSRNPNSTKILFAPEMVITVFGHLFSFPSFQEIVCGNAAKHPDANNRPPTSPVARPGSVLVKRPLFTAVPPNFFFSFWEYPDAVPREM